MSVFNQAHMEDKVLDWVGSNRGPENLKATFSQWLKSQHVDVAEASTRKAAINTYLGSLEDTCRDFLKDFGSKADKKEMLAIAQHQLTRAGIAKTILAKFSAVAVLVAACAFIFNQTSGKQET